MLTWGDKIEFLEKRREAGQAAPALDNKPELKEDLVWYYQAFNFLSSRRPYSMSALPVPLSEFIAYLTLYPWHDPERFVKYVAHLDTVYLNEKAKQDEAKSKTKTPSSKNIPKRK